MRRKKEKITKRKKWRKPGKNYSKTSRLSREAARKKQGEREIQRMKIEDLEDLAEKGEKMEFLILEETAILTFIDQKSKEERKEWSKLKEIKFLVWEATKTVTDLNNQAPKKEDKTYLKDSPTLLPMAENKKRLNTLKGFFLTIWKLFRMIPI